MPLRPQPQFRLTGYFPQLLNGLEVPAALQRAPDVAVGIAKVLTPRGQVSRRARPYEFGPYDLRAQWGLSEVSRLVCVGNYLDDYLERLWAAQLQGNVWMKVRALGFEFATSLNFSIYLDDPRMEQLINVKRTWLTVQRMQATTAREAVAAKPPFPKGDLRSVGLRSSLIPIPHLQWATILDLQRQLNYAQEQGFHTLTMNLQLIKRQGWDTVAAGIPIIREKAPDLRLFITGVAGLKRMTELAEAFPSASFTNTTAHYLAQRHIRLQRDGTRLIKEPVEGHPDLILAENVRLYQEFVAGLNGHGQTGPRSDTAEEETWQAALHEVTNSLQSRFGFELDAAYDAFDLLASDEAVLGAFQTWLRTGEIERDFRGSYPACGVPRFASPLWGRDAEPTLRKSPKGIPLPWRWPSAESVPHPTLGELLDEGADPVAAFLYLGHMARQVNEEIEVQVGRAGY